MRQFSSGSLARLLIDDMCGMGDQDRAPARPWVLDDGGERLIVNLGRLPRHALWFLPHELHECVHDVNVEDLEVLSIGRIDSLGLQRNFLERSAETLHAWALCVMCAFEFTDVADINSRVVRPPISFLSVATENAPCVVVLSPA